VIKKILVVKYLEIFILNFEISKNHYLKCLRTQYVKANYLNTYPLPYPKKKKKTLDDEKEFSFSFG